MSCCISACSHGDIRVAQSMSCWKVFFGMLFMYRVLLKDNHTFDQTKVYRPNSASCCFDGGGHIGGGVKGSRLCGLPSMSTSVGF